MYGLEGRYATALYSAATKQKKLEQVEKELGRVWVSFPSASRLGVTQGLGAAVCLMLLGRSCLL